LTRPKKKNKKRERAGTDQTLLFRIEEGKIYPKYKPEHIFAETFVRKVSRVHANELYSQTPPFLEASALTVYYLEEISSDPQMPFVGRCL